MHVIWSPFQTSIKKKKKKEKKKKEKKKERVGGERRGGEVSLANTVSQIHKTEQARARVSPGLTDAGASRIRTSERTVLCHSQPSPEGLRPLSARVPTEYTTELSLRASRASF